MDYEHSFGQRLPGVLFPAYQAVRTRNGRLSIRDERDSGMERDTYKPGRHTKEAVAFLKERVGEERFRLIMKSPDSRKYPYVAARLFLSAKDWRKYVWIEKNGTLEGYSDAELPDT